MLEEGVQAGSGIEEPRVEVVVFFGFPINQTHLQKCVGAQPASYLEERNGCQTGQRLNIREDFNKYYAPYAERYCTVLVYFRFS